MRVLITGFGPFPGAPFNPSAALAKALACRRRPAFSALTDRGRVAAQKTAANADPTAADRRSTVDRARRRKPPLIVNAKTPPVLARNRVQHII
jgi:hypothetical protein